MEKPALTSRARIIAVSACRIACITSRKLKRGRSWIDLWNDTLDSRRRSRPVRRLFEDARKKADRKQQDADPRHGKLRGRANPQDGFAARVTLPGVEFQQLFRRTFVFHIGG